MDQELPPLTKSLGSKVVGPFSRKPSKYKDDKYKQHSVYSLTEKQTVVWLDWQRQMHDPVYANQKIVEWRKLQQDDAEHTARRKANNHAWESLQTFEQMLQENVDFLRGKTTLAFYHAAPVFDETIALIPNLIRLHGYGLMTTDSQPGENEISVYRDSKQRCLAWKREQQLAYVTFLCPHQEDYLAMVSKFFVDYKRYLVSVTRLWHDESVSNFVSTVALGRSKTAMKREGLNDAIWHESIWATGATGNVETLIDSHVFAKNDNEIGGYMEVSIVRLGWDVSKFNQDLLQDLLDACSQCKIVPYLHFAK